MHLCPDILSTICADKIQELIITDWSPGVQAVSRLPVIRRGTHPFQIGAIVESADGAFGDVVEEPGTSDRFQGKQGT